MLNFTGVAKAPARRFRVVLVRKASLNACQNERKKTAEVIARDAADAKRVVLQRKENAAFIVEGQPREIK